MISSTYDARRRLHRRVASAVAAAALAVSLAACQLGGDDSDDDKDSSPADDRAAMEDAMLEYAQCMRDQGVPMDDPKPGDRGGVLVNGNEVDPETMQAAEEECGHIMEDAIPEDAMQEIPADQKEAMLAQAQCMREHGWDVPDPQFDGGRVSMELGEGIDPSDPSFQADQEECADEAGLEMPQMEEAP